MPDLSRFRSSPEATALIARDSCFVGRPGNRFPSVHACSFVGFPLCRPFLQSPGVHPLFRIPVSNFERARSGSASSTALTVASFFFLLVSIFFPRVSSAATSPQQRGHSRRTGKEKKGVASRSSVLPRVSLFPFADSSSLERFSRLWLRRRGSVRLIRECDTFLFLSFPRVSGRRAFFRCVTR